MASSRKRPLVTVEGPDAAERFERTMDHLLRVSKEELARREATYQASRADRDRPGPKRSRARQHR